MREPKLFRDIAAVLAAERAALLSGAFDQLDGLGSRKEALFAALRMIPADPVRLRKIGQDVSRNQILLQAALAGIRAATERMGALRTTMSGFQAYGREGQREMVTSVRPRVERKV